MPTYNYNFFLILLNSSVAARVMRHAGANNILVGMRVRVAGRRATEVDDDVRRRSVIRKYNINFIVDKNNILSRSIGNNFRAVYFVLQ